MVEPADQEFEQIVLCNERRAGLRSIIAIHDTSLGPALGGVRMRSYPSHDAAVADALALARAMTYKAALADLPIGGGKSVINADPRSANRDEILMAHARYISSLGGRYIPAVDMGTTVCDMRLIGRFAPLSCAQRVDPGLFTARGVVRSIEAALMHATGKGVDGRRVAVQGLGNVGWNVARMLIEEGADVTAADIDEHKVARGVEELGITPAPLSRILDSDVDVLSPCAGGGVIDAAALDSLRAEVLVGAANNMLSSNTIAVDLAERGIVYVPDFVANAGGLMAMEAELRDDETGLESKVDSIAATALAVLERSAATNLDTVTVATEMARTRVASSRTDQPYFAQAVTAGM